MPDQAKNRWTRRHFVTSAGIAAATAGLVACGGTSSPGAVENAAKQPVTTLLDETEKAKPGGTLKIARAIPASIDPHTAPGTYRAFYGYGLLLQLKPGRLKNSDGSLQGDIFESWEQSPDKLTLVGKLNPNARFAQVAPVNGRAVDAADVLFSWTRYASLSPSRSDLAQSAGGPITSLTSPDARTIQIKFAEPNATVNSLLAGTRTGGLFALPKEAADRAALDLRNTEAGSGPFHTTSYVESVSQKYERNRNYVSSRTPGPFIDGMELTNITEYAAALAQFKAGAIFDFSQGLSMDDLLALKREVTGLDVSDTGPSAAYVRTLFGNNPDSPFRDERVRQAYMMTYDRDLYFNVIFSLDALKKAGLPAAPFSECGLGADAFEGWWLDPDSKDFGPNSKYLKYDLAEAKKLLAAAGHASALDYDVYYPQPGYLAAFYRYVEPLIGFARDSKLFRPSIKTLDYNTEWNSRFRLNKGAFTGVAYFQDATGALDPSNRLYATYNSGGSTYFGGDSTLDDLTSRATREFDAEKRRSLAHDVQRYVAGKMYSPRIGGAPGYQLTWEVIRNKFVWQAGGGTLIDPQTVWLDTTKKPLK